MPSLSWLHLSDWHHGNQGQQWLWPTLRQEFYDDLSKLSEMAGPWDAVIFSGDITQKGTNEEFDEVNDALIELWKHLKSLGSEPVMVAVPGNHDLTRPDSSDPVVKAFRQWDKDKEIREVFWNRESKNQYLDAVHKNFENYTKWYDQLPVPKPKSITPGYLPGEFSTILSKGNYKVGIVGLNLGFLQMTTDNFERKLDVHPKQLCVACAGDPYKWKQDLDFAFLLSHHPVDWLSPRGQKVYNSEVAPPGMFFAHMCGHLHVPKCVGFTEFGSEERRNWQGPSIFGLEAYGGKEERIHGYNSCKIEFGTNSNIVTIWPRKMEQKYSGKRKLGPDSGYELNENNALVIEVESKQVESTPEPNQMEAYTTKPAFLSEIDSTESDIDIRVNTSKLNNVPQLKIQSMPHHMQIRHEERTLFNTVLAEQRMVWLISDWGQGKIGFISSALTNQDSIESASVFHLQCEEIVNLDDLINAFEEQFGMSLQELLNVATEVAKPYIFFENLSLDLFNEETDVNRFKEIIQAITDYHQSIRCIFDSRREMKSMSAITVRLQALDLLNTQNYVHHHPDTISTTITSDTIEHLYMWSDGLPMYLDYLIRSLRVCQLKDLIAIEVETKYEELQQAEPVPKAFLHAVTSLAKSESRYSRRSYRLLKILSTLSDGSPLNNIKRFDHAEPFYDQNALELESLGLLDIIPLNKITLEIGEITLSIETDCPKLLKVPKQVRDYVKTILSPEEQSSIVRRSADILFGEKWREGKVNINTNYLSNVVGGTAQTLGNEHTITRQLLWEAVQENDDASIKKIIFLANSYLKKLTKADCYKEVFYGAEELLNILATIANTSEKVDLALLLGQAARMVGKRERAIQILRNLLEDKSVTLTKDQRASAYLELAIAYNSKGDKIEAIEASTKVQSLVKKGSPYYDQALSIELENSVDADIFSKLKHIETKSRRLKRLTLANNLAITLATMSNTYEAKIKYYDSVMSSSANDYNRVRAVLGKADELLKNGRVSDLKSRDKILLEAAFSYSYSQKIQGLFNKCVRIIWDILYLNGKYSQLLKLFKYASLLWRIRDELALEKKYLGKLKQISHDSFSRGESPESQYYNLRVAALGNWVE